MCLPLWKKLRGLASALDRDRSGIAVIYVAMALPVIIGFSLLAIDVGRVTTLQSSLQHGSDALALAGAGELDRSPDSITRSERAITNLITTNNSLFATSAVVVNRADVSTCYLATLPPSDATSLEGNASYPCLATGNASQIATSSALARYVRVKVNPTNFTTVFPATFLGALSNSLTASAEAVAGFDAAVCNFTPMFMCNPLEPSGNASLTNDFGLYAMANDYTTRRKVIRFLAFTGGANVTAVPGQFGFLDIKGSTGGGGGASALADEIALPTPKECYLLNSLQTKTGSMTELAQAFNTRFDMYSNANNTGKFTATAYPPAMNVRKGFPTTYTTTSKGKSGQTTTSSSPGPCATSAPASGSNIPAQVMAFPVDSCFSDNSCASGGGNANIGKGVDWAYDPDSGSTSLAFRGATNAYWDLNFGAAPVPTAECGGTACSNTNLPSRYDMYRYEITNNLYKDYSGTNGSTSAPTPAVNVSQATETGVASCAASNGVSPVDTSTGGVDRRILYGAIMNCIANGLQPGSNGSYHALAFGKFFMVRPVTSSNILWTELVSIVAPGDNSGVARDRVELYR